MKPGPVPEWRLRFRGIAILTGCLGPAFALGGMLAADHFREVLFPRQGLAILMFLTGAVFALVSIPCGLISRNFGVALVGVVTAVVMAWLIPAFLLIY